jgi:hypothetical protein
MTKTLLIAATVFAAIITVTSVSAQQDLFEATRRWTSRR